MSGKKRDALNITASERRIMVLKLRGYGYALRDIAQELGVSLGTVHRDIQKALTELAQQEIKETRLLRNQMLERIDMARRAIFKEVLGGNLWAIDRWINLNEQEIRLFGLNELPDWNFPFDQDVVEILMNRGQLPSAVAQQFNEMIRAKAERDKQQDVEK